MKRKPKLVSPRSPSSPIEVKLPREDRLQTVAVLAEAIKKLADALTVAPSVTVQNVEIRTAKTGIWIGFDDPKAST